MLKGLGPMRLAAIAGVGVSILGFFIYLMSRVAAPQMALLYGGLDNADSNAIIEKLQADHVPFELRKDGAQIWVPNDKKNEMRVKMAEVGLPTGGEIAGFELFDKQNALGTTSFKQHVEYVRALEGELSRTIRWINSIQYARVNLVLPQREPFTRDIIKPSASIILKMRGGMRLNQEQVGAIQHLVAAAVPNMQPDRISIVDGQGTLLARGFESAADAARTRAERLQISTQNRLERAIEDMLERTLGPGRVRAEVNVQMNTSRSVVTEELYDPNSRVVRSEVTVDQKDASKNGQQPIVSVTQNLPDPNASSSSNQISTSNESRSQDTVNYEINKTVKNIVNQAGGIKRISAAILVDGTYTKGPKGQEIYHERSPKELAQIKALVESAIGYSKARGDQVTVESMQFAGGLQQFQAQRPGELIFGMRRDFVEKIASNLGLSVVAILFLLLVLRPLISRAIESMQSAPVGPDGRRLLGGEAGMVPQLAGPGAAPLPAPALGGEEEVIADELIDIDKVEGRVKASSIRKIGEIVDKHPEEALSILRTWMYQET